MGEEDLISGKVSFEGSEDKQGASTGQAGMSRGEALAPRGGQEVKTGLF